MRDYSRLKQQQKSFRVYKLQCILSPLVTDLSLISTSEFASLVDAVLSLMFDDLSQKFKRFSTRLNHLHSSNNDNFSSTPLVPCSALSYTTPPCVSRGSKMSDLVVGRTQQSSTTPFNPFVYSGDPTCSDLVIGRTQ